MFCSQCFSQIQYLYDARWSIQQKHLAILPSTTSKICKTERNLSLTFRSSSFMWFLDWWTWLSRYVECTSAAIQSLESFKKIHPEYRRKDIEVCIKKAMNFIESRQSPDGSWWVYAHNNSITTSIHPPLGNWFIDEKSTYAWSVRYGSWGVCYTYGTWFGVTGLVAGGRTTKTAFVSEKLVISSCPNNSHLEVGEKAIFQARTK